MTDHGFADFFEALGRTIAFHPEMARMLDSIKAALFLQQLLWWTPKAQDPDGWVYKSVKEWEAETSLTYEEQRVVRKLLVKKKVLEERPSRLEHRVYYRVDRKVLGDLWAEWTRGASRETLVGEMGKPKMANWGNPSSVLPGEDVQERTSEIKSEAPRTVVRGRASDSGVSTARTDTAPWPDVVETFDRFWEDIPKRISRGTARVDAFQAWKALAPEVREFVHYRVEEFLADDVSGLLYDFDGSVRVTPAELIGMALQSLENGTDLDSEMVDDLLDRPM